MSTNVLKAIRNIKKNDEYDFSKLYPPKSEISTHNRVNSVGDALELFTKDAFCGSFDLEIKDNVFASNFSYLGNKNNPPDLIVKKGDAIEVKKLAGYTSTIQLNSSYPKSALYSNSSLITNACRDCEPTWSKKDMVYAVGVIKDKTLKTFVLIYGDCYAASPDIYERVQNIINEGLHKTNLEMPKTNELGRVNKVDPLGITDLRIRGMWLIKNPLTVFSSLFKFRESEQKFSLIALMKKEKYESFPKVDKESLEKDPLIKISHVRIKNPDNPANLNDSVMIRYDKF